MTTGIMWGMIAQVAALTLSAAAGSIAGETHVAKWKGDQAAAFLLMFDDSWPSHFQVAAPALAERGMNATFYINPGKGEYRVFSNQWETSVWKLGMAYGNHTFAHASVTNAAQAEQVIKACNDEILRMVPGRVPRLVSYGQPGVKEWLVSSNDLQVILDRHHLISRPPFAGHGAVYHWQTSTQMLALADKAIASRGLEYLVIHGVERIKPEWKYQDFWPLKQSIFFALLDGLKERRDQGKLWITDHISAHKYETERDTAAVAVQSASPRELRLSLTCKADPAFYDEPLTLVTRVPPDWASCVVASGGSNTVAKVVQGVVRYDALPDGKPILLRKAN